jgi:hypothetical protein
MKKSSTSKSLKNAKPMPTGRFTITINKFRPMGVGFPISATMIPDIDNPKCITIHGEDITIKGSDPVKLVFTLPNPSADDGFVLLGIGFAANSPSTTVGLHTFPTITIDRFPTSSTMTVADHPQDVGIQRYDYVMLVQKISSGEIGIIDPSMINEPGRP